MVTTLEYGFMVFWYIVLIAAIICYAMLDGFDLGVGVLHLFVRKDQERRIFLNAIGPVWDGNEVWLVIIIGAMFAGFPFAYATLFSSFYIPLMFLIFALMFRAVAIEFRSKLHYTFWRNMWDISFFLGSLLIAFGVGITLGNLVEGIPLDENHLYTGSIMMTYLRPYPVLVGIMTVSLFMMHGVIYLVMKTENELQQKLISWVRPTMIFFIVAYAVTTMTTLIYQLHMVDRFRENPYLFLVALVNMLVIANIPREISKKNYGWAFISSCLNIAFLLALFALGTFPEVIRSSVNPETNSITVISASASLKTLQVLAIVVAIGLPIVFAYGFYVYRVFRGKVRMDHMSY
ncbi:MAG: Cytochrome bd-I ubiquinol oxidase subunit 2 [Chlamydiales bacterium]|nr:Cytochrome bd-I ubiquinol oxidase subunit 2 [Chlamydiales bacterium]